MMGDNAYKKDSLKGHNSQVSMSIFTAGKVSIQIDSCAENIFRQKDGQADSST